jgi:hypothetical protein
VSKKHELVIQSLYHLNRELFDLLQGVMVASMPISAHEDPLSDNSELPTAYIHNLTHAVSKVFGSTAYQAGKAVYESSQEKGVRESE